jgi:GNAT superfamily N-acetyltransferase
MRASFRAGDAVMHHIEEQLVATHRSRTRYILRPPLPGDVDWVVSCHSALYAEEYGWNGHETMAAEMLTEFVKDHDARRERGWIVEMDNENVGSVFLVNQSADVAKLCLLLVVPQARGLGIGGRLVDECVNFARQAGYRKITLWTQSILHTARHIYERAGFRLVRQNHHHSFGHDLIGETWELTL